MTKEKALEMASNYGLESDVQAYFNELVEDSDHMYTDTPTKDTSDMWEQALDVVVAAYLDTAHEEANEEAQKEGDNDKILSLMKRYHTLSKALWAISKQFEVSTNDVIRWNQLSSTAQIYPGDELTIYHR